MILVNWEHYTDINSEYDTLVSRLNTLIEDLLLAEDSINMIIVMVSNHY